MKTDTRWIRELDRELRANALMTTPTALLLAVDGFSEPDRECNPGELLFPTTWCGEWACSCGDELHGISTHGNSAVGRITFARGAPRIVFEQMIAIAMRHHKGFKEPEAAAAAYLDELAMLAEGQLVRREHGQLFPFPLDSTIGLDHTISYRIDENT
jgi:hypothetical protein